MRTGPCHSVEMPFMHLVINVIFLRRILDCFLPKYFQWSRNYPELQSWNIGMHSLNQSAYSIQLAGKIGLWWAHNQSHAYQDECDQILRLLFELFHLSLKPERMWGLAFSCHSTSTLSLSEGWAQRWRKGNLDGTTWAPSPAVSNLAQPWSFYLNRPINIFLKTKSLKLNSNW